jgi:hypothetical protein
MNFLSALLYQKEKPLSYFERPGDYNEYKAFTRKIYLPSPGHLCPAFNLCS